jgi:hypothetical protein
MTYDNLEHPDIVGKTHANDKSTPVDDWQHVGTIADRLVTAWSNVEAREEAGNLAAWTTERQRSLIFQEMWVRASHEWHIWALDWVTSQQAKRGIERHRQVEEGEE